MDNQGRCISKKCMKFQKMKDQSSWVCIPLNKAERESVGERTSVLQGKEGEVPENRHHKVLIAATLISL